MNFLPRNLTFAIIFHYICYIIMQTTALFAETKRGPVLQDLFHQWIPVIDWFRWFNTSFWLQGLLVSMLLLIIFKRKLGIQYLMLGGIVSLLRGLFIPITTLGPPDGIYASDFMLNLTSDQISWGLLLKQWFPIDIFWGGAEYSAAYLTQDLFFSGHTASTFLLVLVVKQNRKWFYSFLIFHIFTVISLLFTHLHYTIDIIAAYFIVYWVYYFLTVQHSWLRVEQNENIPQENGN